MNPWTAARGRVFKRGDWWISEVIDSTGRVVLYDRGSRYDSILKSSLRDVAVARRVEGAGHKFKHSYEELVVRSRRKR